MFYALHSPKLYDIASNCQVISSLFGLFGSVHGSLEILDIYEKIFEKKLDIGRYLPYSFY
jgi:hypothetical protein